ncbi:fumarylacetoacetate hydrolase family protein [Streptomyces werraensis]|uniref:Fumarylacetoacetate hydrolase family protein n=1 Tax=Streptomyces werraensis TaxID=68284 RepID=A0ABV3JMU7_9ACTN
MRLANLDGRLSLVHGDGLVDVERLSGGRFGPDPQEAFGRWDEFSAWAATADLAAAEVLPFQPEHLGPPVPAPRQVFAVGLNYDEHARESGFVRPAAPLVFTKYPSSLTGPVSTVHLPTDTVDWEVELVVVIGRQAQRVAAHDSWSHVAGLTVGQDLSERTSQHAGPAAQFCLAKSFPGFSPTGPFLVTPDEFDDPEDLALMCEADGVVLQEGRTSQMIFPVRELIAHLSSVVTLYPGDLIFTGTPAGVGAGRTPPVYLRPGQTLHSRIAGLGEIRQTFTGGA